MAAGLPAAAETIMVGPGARIEDAVARARPGDVVEVYPQPFPENKPYTRVAVVIDRPRITIRGISQMKGQIPRLSGEGGDYSGVGRVPRAIFQFNPGADDCVLEDMILFGAHNDTHNAAGVRVHQANRVTLRRLTISGCDMGVMSNGDGTLNTAAGLLIDSCEIHRNGDPSHPGFSHNLYLGGTSAVIRRCDIHSSVTGHNVKSRAHVTRVEFSRIHDSANRELDLVDAEDTARPGSHAVLVGNVIAKKRDCPGNREVIHFGQDGGGEHDGTLHLVHNTIMTRFAAPVVTLSAPKARTRIEGNILWDDMSGQKGLTVAAATRGAALTSVSGERNWLSPGFDPVPGTGIRPTPDSILPAGEHPFQSPYVDPADYRLKAPVRGIVNVGRPIKAWDLPPAPGLAAATAWGVEAIRSARGRRDDGKPDAGAFEWGP
jgi:hypothetical protein